MLEKTFAFRAFDYDGAGATCDKLGSCEISLEQLDEGAGESHEFTLDLTDPKIKGSQGDLYISIRCGPRQIREAH